MEMLPDLLGCKELSKATEVQELAHCRCSVNVIFFPLLAEGGKCYTFILDLVSDLETLVDFNLVE